MGKACVQPRHFPVPNPPSNVCLGRIRFFSETRNTLPDFVFTISMPVTSEAQRVRISSDSWSFATDSKVWNSGATTAPPSSSLFSSCAAAAASTLGDGPGWMMFFKRLWYWSSWTFCSFSNLGKLQRKRWVAEESQISRYHIYHQPEAGNNFPPQLQPLLTTSNWAVTSPPILVHWRTWSGWILKSWPDFTSTFISKVSGASTYLLPSISCFSWGPEAGSAFYEKRDLQNKTTSWLMLTGKNERRKELKPSTNPAKLSAPL